MKNIINFINKDNIDNPPYDYNFLLNLEKNDYPKYLAKIFKYSTGEELPLFKVWSFKSGEWNYKINKKKLKTFNQKIQWIKLYGITPLMRDCTDKVKVRDYVKEKIGDEYLKPVLQVVRSKEIGVRSNNLNFSLSTLNTPLFDKIDFDKLPDSFVIKCNHGCKWHFIIKNKEEYLNNKRLVDITRRNITGWLEQDYSLWGGFELNYRGIEPKILIEPLLRNNIHKNTEQIQIYCFSSIPQFVIRIEENSNNKTTLYDEKLNIIDEVFSIGDIKINRKADNLLNQAFDLSKKLSQDFLFVRVDWMVYQNKLYFEELTFTPYSGFSRIIKPEFNRYFGNLINLERSKNEF